MVLQGLVVFPKGLQPLANEDLPGPGAPSSLVTRSSQRASVVP